MRWNESGPTGIPTAMNGNHSNNPTYHSPEPWRMQKSTIGSKKQAGDEVPQELRELTSAIDALPARYRDTIAPALSRAIECSTRRRRILNLVQEALSQLRLDMKYLVFDLEATRRERDQYREILEKEDLL